MIVQRFNISLALMICMWMMLDVIDDGGLVYKCRRGYENEEVRT